MSSREWDPLREMIGVQERMNKLFESALARTKFDAEGEVGAWSPVADVWETPHHIVLSLELPGLSQSDMSVQVDGDELVVAGERRAEPEQPGVQYHRMERSQGRFARRFSLPSNARRDSVRAEYRDGVLIVTVPKESEIERRSFKVSVR